jgi:intracellular sulfur oxidation DsrE/DsrF family protein
MSDTTHHADQPVSDEYLHAFLDGELAAGEREQALGRLERDEDFKRRLCEARGLKEQVKGAYAELASAPQRRGFRLWAGSMASTGRQALAAGILLALGVAGGWLAHDAADQAPAFERLAGLPEGYRPMALTGRVDPDRVVLHLDDSDPARLGAALDLAESLLARRGEGGRVKLVVNSYGLNLLRQEISPYQARIGGMAARHPNLEFIACGQTIARLNREGVVVDLLPQARVANSAIGEILERMQQGWVYVKI